MKRWEIRVRGILTTKIELRDDHGHQIAQIEWSGKARYRRAIATDHDGQRWDITIDGYDVSVLRAGEVRAAARNHLLTFAGDQFGWHFDTENTRRGKVLDHRSRTVLQTAPGPGRRSRWATVDLEPTLRDPLPVVLAASLLILSIDAQIGVGMAGSGTGGVPPN